MIHHVVYNICVLEKEIEKSAFLAGGVGQGNENIWRKKGGKSPFWQERQGEESRQHMKLRQRGAWSGRRTSSMMLGGSRMEGSSR